MNDTEKKIKVFLFGCGFRPSYYSECDRESERGKYRYVKVGFIVPDVPSNTKNTTTTDKVEKEEVTV